MPNPKPKIQIENLVKIYGKNPQHALKLFRQGGNRDEIFTATGHVLGIADVSLSITEGELFVVMGLSGSGKSTLVRCLNRLIPVTSGHVYIDGEDIVNVDKKRLREVRRTKMSMVFQRFGLFPHKTVAENVEYGLKVQGMGANERRDKAIETLEVVGLAKWADYAPDSLSGGMQQRVGLARALATDAPIMLMDEAFGALDPLIRRDMQDELLRLQRELKKTIVFISHDIQEALKLGDRVAVMKDGYLVQVGTPEELVTQPADEYIRDFIQDVNRAQVLKAGSIRRQTVPFILGQDSLPSVLEQMRQHQRQDTFVLDRQGQPVGYVTASQLDAALQQGLEDITTVMARDFPKVQATDTLEEIFPQCHALQPLAVVDNDGKFEGMVQHADIFSSIGRLGEVKTEAPVSQVVEQSPQMAVS